MNWLARLDVIILAALLAYTLFLVIRVSYRIHVVQRSQETDRTHRSQLLAEVDVEVANIGSISSTAPYVGLVGTCFGIASVFQGFDLEKHAALVMLTSKVAASLLTAAAGMIVAIAATCSYNYLRTRLDLLENRVPIRGLRLARRISLPPSFALIAAPSLAILVVVYTTFVSFYTPLGFAIEVPSAGCESKTADRMIALHIANGGTLFVDSKHQEWATLESQLSKGHGTRVHRVCLSADENVPFQAVADAIDIVKNTPTAGDVSIATHRRKFDGPKSDEHSLP